MAVDLLNLTEKKKASHAVAFYFFYLVLSFIGLGAIGMVVGIGIKNSRPYVNRRCSKKIRLLHRHGACLDFFKYFLLCSFIQEKIAISGYVRSYGGSKFSAGSVRRCNSWPFTSGFINNKST